jgi:hypothetical protein
MAENAIVGLVNSIRDAEPAATQPPATDATGLPSKRSVVNLSIPQNADPADSEAVLDLRSESSVRIARLLDGLRRTGAPALIERTKDRVITNVLKPLFGRVVDIRETKDGWLRVHIDRSSASHYIKPSPETQAFIELLKSARDRGDVLLVTEDPKGTAIVDVRPYPDGWPTPRPEPEPEQPTALSEDDVKNLLSPRRASDIHVGFQSLLQRSCDVDGARSGCLPFLYARDGCRARAHRMCELLEEGGIATAKIWVYADENDLKPLTPNLEECEAKWVLHVASVAHAEETGELLVIDPSLFEAPVPVQTFIDAMRSPGAERVFTDRFVYNRLRLDSPGRPEFLDANARGVRESLDELDDFRVDLEAMYPAPPFQQCLVRPPST